MNKRTFAAHIATLLGRAERGSRLSTRACAYLLGVSAKWAADIMNEAARLRFVDKVYQPDGRLTWVVIV